MASATRRPVPATARMRAPDPRRPAGSRSHGASGSGHCAAAVRTASDNGAPAAIHSCSATRSRSVTSSVTPCSTWRRALTSRNQNRRSVSKRNSAVAALCSFAARAARMARSCSSARSSGVSPGAGDSSTSFWCRRWIEQSRSPSATIVPSASPSSCTSMWRAGRTSRSRYTAAVAECRQRLRRASGQRGRQVRRRRDASHATTSAAGRGLDEQRKADVLGGSDDGRRLVGSVDRCSLVRPRHHRDAGVLGRPARRQLVAEGVDRVGRRSDEGETGVDHRSRECRALRQEAVARVDRLGAGLERGLDDRVGAEVALRRGRRTEAHRRVGGLDMGRIGIGVGVDRDGLDAEIAAGPDDAKGDLSPVRDEDPRKRPGSVFAQRRGLPRRPRRRGHSGMLPCFFGGFVSRLSASISNAAMSRGRVSDGWMTSSTYPRAAAAYGLAKRSS